LSGGYILQLSQSISKQFPIAFSNALPCKIKNTVHNKSSALQVKTKLAQQHWFSIVVAARKPTALNL
jgi:hypothetical protein